MTNIDVHDELTLLGVSSEVHNLVDDLDLTLREPPKGELLCFLPRKTFIPAKKNVYKSQNKVCYEQGRLFQTDNFSVWQMRRMSRKKTERICSIVSFGSRKRR